SKGRLVALFGCGGDRDPYKRPIMGEAAARLADFVIVTSDNPRTENPEKIVEQILPGVTKYDTPYVVIVNRREAMKYAVEHARSNDVIVFAGKGHEDYQILATGKIHFDEREVLDEIFAELYPEQK
ncbi:MAG: glutamate ligase domain-containing protein, partial [Acutalibacteraceae bacterium]